MSKGKENKPHIGIFGRRNSGKSSIINALAGQEIAIVSAVGGTTTDPVKKSIEIHGIGPVVVVDTAGIDDSGDIGLKRVEKSLQTIPLIDLAIVVAVDNDLTETEIDLIHRLNVYNTPFIVIHNKRDRMPSTHLFRERIRTEFGTEVVDFKALSASQSSTSEIIDLIRRQMPESAYLSRSIIGDLIKPGDVVLLIAPVDTAAPEGRLILPQVQVIRDVLDHDAIAVVVKENDVETHVRRIQPEPALAITDSQVFQKADAAIPKHIPLTSFSILLARQKGDFDNYLKGTPQIDSLQHGDRVLILESCTHIVTCEDIGRIKIPQWIGKYTGKQLEFDVVAGLSALQRNISEYSLVIQCGGCVATRKQIISRLKPAVDAGIPVTNYGMAIAWIHGIYQRAVAPFIEKKIPTQPDDA